MFKIILNILKFLFLLYNTLSGLICLSTFFFLHIFSFSEYTHTHTHTCTHTTLSFYRSLYLLSLNIRNTKLTINDLLHFCSCSLKYSHFFTLTIVYFVFQIRICGNTVSYISFQLTYYI